MALTPEQVVEKKFAPTKFREGYDQDEVDDFLDEVVSELNRLNTENDELRKKLATCERRVSELSRDTATGTQPVVAPVESNPTPVVQPAAAVAADNVSAPASMQSNPVSSDTGPGESGANPEAATGMLALAQKLHDEHVRSGEQRRDELVAQAEMKVARMLSDAEQKHRDTLGSLERERSVLERKIEELRAFERDYRARLKSYLETQLRDLEAKGSLVPSRGQTEVKSA